MTRRRRTPGSVFVAIVSLGVAACSSSPASGPPAPQSGGTPAIRRPLAARIEVAAYAGAFARDENVAAFAAAVEAAAPATIESLRERAGLQFVRDRGPRVVLVDGASVPLAGRVEIRIVEGLRRPEIRIRAASVAAGEFVVERDLAPLLAEAAVLAAAGERAPPPWIREGLALHLGGALERRVLEAALARPEVPLGTLDDAALAPGFRAAALERIAVGVRPLQRYLARRLTGIDEETALREIGIEGEEFLDAAATTERSRAFRDLSEDAGVVAVRDARAAFLRGDLDAAESILAREESFGSVAAAKDLVAAEVALARGDLLAAEWSVERSLAVHGPGTRVRDARWLLAETARADDIQRRRFLTYARWFPDDLRVAFFGNFEHFHGLDGAALRGSVDAEPAERAAAAKALGASEASTAAAALESLRPMLGDGQPSVRRAAAEALGALGIPDSASDLDALGGDPDGTVRAAALEALARIDRPRAQSRATLLLDDPSPEVRAAAGRVLAVPPPRDE